MQFRLRRKLDTLTSSLHKVETTIVPFQTKCPGRPSKNGPARTKKKYRLEWKIVPRKELIEKARTVAGCFVLIANVPVNGENALNSKEVLRTYKGQYGVESDFVFLKDPLIVNDIFLEKST